MFWSWMWRIIRHAHSLVANEPICRKQNLILATHFINFIVYFRFLYTRSDRCRRILISKRQRIEILFSFFENSSFTCINNAYKAFNYTSYPWESRKFFLINFKKQLSWLFLKKLHWHLKAGFDLVFWKTSVIWDKCKKLSIFEGIYSAI